MYSKENSSQQSIRRSQKYQRLSLPSAPTCEPTKPKRNLTLDGSASFTERKKQNERQKHEEQRRNKIDQNFLMFMTRLHEHYASKQVGPVPRRSPESIVLNISDSCFLPTVMTSDLSAESEHNYSDLQNDGEIPLESETKRSVPSHPSKKSLIPVRSPKSATARNLQVNQDQTLASHATQEHHIAEGMTQLLTELPKNTASDGSKKNNAPGEIVPDERSLTSVTDFKPASSVLINDETLEKKRTISQPLTTVGTKADVAASRPESGTVISTRYPTDASSERAPLIQLSSNDDVRDTKETLSIKMAGFVRQKSNENSTSLKNRGETSRDMNMKALRNALTIVKRPARYLQRSSDLSLEKGGVKAHQNDVTDRLVRLEKRPAIFITKNSEIQQMSSSICQFALPKKLPSICDNIFEKKIGLTALECLDSKKQTGVYRSVNRSQSLGSRTKSFIPVRKRAQLWEQQVREEVSTGQTIESETYLFSAENVTRKNGSRNKTNPNNKEFGLCFPKPRSLPVRGARLNSTQPPAHVTAQPINQKDDQFKTKKPPLPIHSFRSKQLTITRPGSRLPLKQNQSAKPHPPTVKFTPKFTSAASTRAAEKTPNRLWAKKSPYKRTTSTRKLSSSPSKSRTLKAHTNERDTPIAKSPIKIKSTSRESSLSFSLLSPTYNPTTHTKSIQTEIKAIQSTETFPEEMLPTYSRRTQIPSRSESTSNLQTTAMYDAIKQAILHGHFKTAQTRTVQNKGSQTRKRRKQKQLIRMQTNISPVLDNLKQIIKEKQIAAKSNRSFYEKMTPSGGTIQKLRDVGSPNNTFMRKIPGSLPSPKAEHKNKGFKCQVGDSCVTSLKRQSLGQLDNSCITSLKRQSLGQLDNSCITSEIRQSLGELDNSCITSAIRESITPDEISSKVRGIKSVLTYPHKQGILHSETRGSGKTNHEKVTFLESDTTGQKSVPHWEGEQYYPKSERHIHSKDERGPDNSHATGDTELILDASERDQSSTKSSEDRMEAKRIQETEGKSVAWNISESDVLVKSSKSAYNKQNLRKMEEDRKCVGARGSLRSSQVVLGKSSTPQMINRKSNMINVHKSLPERLESPRHWLKGSLPVEVGRIDRQDRPPEGGNIVWPLNYKVSSNVAPFLGVATGSLVQSEVVSNSNEEGNEDADEDVDEDASEEVDEDVLADMEEVLIQVSKTHGLQTQRVMALQEDIRRLRASLSLIGPPTKPGERGPEKWEGTLFDYLMLLGFMAIQFCVQYVLLKK